MRRFFGYLFLIIAIILTIVQATSFLSYSGMSGGRIFLVILLTVGSAISANILLGSKNYGRNESSDKFAYGTALFACLALVVLMAHAVLTGNNSITGWEYFILLIYTCTWGAIGFSGVLHN